MQRSFFFNDTATAEIYTLSLHDALPICTSGRVAGSTCRCSSGRGPPTTSSRSTKGSRTSSRRSPTAPATAARSEEHTSELQSRQYIVCRLLLEKKKKLYNEHPILISYM